MNVFIEVRRLDKCKCQVWGCGNTNVEVHHIIPRSHGGPDKTWNLICLCSEHHALVTCKKLKDVDILKRIKKKRNFRWSRALSWHEDKEELRRLKRDWNAE